MGNYILSYDNLIIHPSLTYAAVDIYNKKIGKNLSQDKVNLIIKGVIAEDAIPRYLNHFYNPATGQGLNDGLAKGKSAKLWAQEQNGAVGISGDYSVSTILSNYKKGNTKRAYQGIGHILHLVQDMSVPAHTRNDAHPEGDPYEEWAEQYGKPNLSRVKFIKVENIDNVFDELATYSYYNFYSKDTRDNSIINDDIKEEKDIEGNDTVYVYRNNYRLFTIKKHVWGNEDYFDFRVNLDYWNLLSPKAIGYSAGIIDYFIKEFIKIDLEKKETQEKLNFLEKVAEGLVFVKESAKYQLGDGLIVVGSSTGKVVSMAKNIFSELGQEIGFLASGSKEAVLDVSKQSLNAAKNIDKDIQVVLDYGAQSIMTIMPTMSVIPEIAQASPLVLISNKNDFKKSNLVISKNLSPKLVAKQDNIPIKMLDKILEPEQDIIKIDVPKIIEEKVEIIKIPQNTKVDENSNQEIIVESIVLDEEVPTQPIIQVNGFSPGFVVSNGRGFVAPDTFIIASPSAISSSTSASFVFASDQKDINFLYNFNYNGWMDAENDELNIINLEDGEYNLQVKAQNQGDAFDPSPEQYNWVIDTMFPVITTVNSPSNFTNLTSASFLLESNESVLWQCQINDSVMQACSASSTIFSLEEGSHQFSVIAQDVAGNIASTTYNWVVDISPPISSITNLNIFYPSTDFSFNINGDDTLGATSTSGVNSFDVQYKIDTEDWQNLEVATTSNIITFNRKINLGSSVFFRARSYDNALNIGKWSSEQVAQIGTNHLVISEVKISDTQANDEFIEIYNPTDNDIDLSNYSVQYRGSRANSFKKKNFESNNIILSKGYFLITSNQYTGEVEANISHASFNLSGVGGTIFLVSNKDFLTNDTATSTVILDRLSYGLGDYLFPEGSAYQIVPQAGQSLERKALASSSLISINNEDNLIGNAYDFNDNNTDFIIQTIINPQNSRSPTEPRDVNDLVPKIISLKSQNISTTSVELTWNAQSNANIADGAYYDARYIVKDIDCNLQINWASATQVNNMPTPLAQAGQMQNIIINNLLKETEYCFVIKTFNGQFWSNFSNQLSAVTLAEVALIDQPPQSNGSIKTDQSHTSGSLAIDFGSNQHKEMTRYVFQSFVAQVNNIVGVKLKICRNYFNERKDLIVDVCKNGLGGSCAQASIVGSDIGAIGICDDTPGSITLLFDESLVAIPGESYSMSISVSSFSLPYSPAFKILASPNNGYASGYMDLKKNVWANLQGYDLWFKTLYR